MKIQWGLAPLAVLLGMGTFGCRADVQVWPDPTATGGTGGTGGDATTGGTGGSAVDSGSGGETSGGSGGTSAGTGGDGGSAGADASATDGGTMGEPDVLCRYSGEHCMFMAWVTSAGDMVYRGANASGEWSGLRTIPAPGPANCVVLETLEESNGNRFLWAIWSTIDGAIRAGATHNGVDWLDMGLIADAGTTSSCPAAAEFAPNPMDRRIFIAWADVDGGIRGVTHTGVGDYSAPFTIAPAGSTTKAPSLASVLESDSLPHLWAVWTGGNGSIQWARGDGTTWDPATEPFGAGTTPDAPAVGMLAEDSGNTYGWVAWRRSTGSIEFSWNNDPVAPWPSGAPIAPDGSSETGPVLENFEDLMSPHFMVAAWARSGIAYYATSNGVDPFSPPFAVPGSESVKGRPALGSLLIQ